MKQQINHKKYLEKFDYSSINEDDDLTNYVINIRILKNTDYNYVKKTMLKLNDLFKKYIKKNDISLYHGNNFQIRIHKKNINKIIPLIKKQLSNFKIIYHMVICNYINQDQNPIGLSVCDGLIEAGELFDNLKQYPKSLILFYDRKSRLKMHLKLKSY